MYNLSFIRSLTRTLVVEIRWIIVLACFSALTNIYAADVIRVLVKAKATNEVTEASALFAGTDIPINDPAGVEVDVLLGEPYYFILKGTSEQKGSTEYENSVEVTCETCFKMVTPDGAGGPSFDDGASLIVDQYDIEFNATVPVHLMELPDDEANDFGGGDGSSSGGCGSCGGGGGGGGGTTASIKAPSTEFRSGLGRDSSGKPFGIISFNHEIEAGMVNRSNFEYQPYSDFVQPELITDSTGLRQAFTPEGLLDFVDLLDGSIELRFYKPSAVGAKDGNGYYTVSEGAFLIKKFTPATDVVAGDGLIYSETISGETVSESYFAESNGSGSTIERHVDALGVITEEITNLTVDLIDPTLWTRVVVTRQLIDDNGTEVEISNRQEEYASRGFGEVLDRVIEDPNGAALTTQYVYYENETNDGAYYKELKYRINPDGDWKKMLYDVDGKLSVVLSPWLDAPAHPDSADENNCVAVYTNYDDDGLANGSSKKILGTQVSYEQTYIDYSDYETFGGVTRYFITEETRSYHGSSIEYLSSSTSYWPDYSAAGPKKGEMFRRVSEDGTAYRVIEEKGTYEENLGSFTVLSTGAYTRRTETNGTLTQPDGIANKTMRTITISDFKGAHRVESQIYTGSGFETVSIQNYSYESGPGRKLLSITQDGDVVLSRTYVGESEQTETDAQGVQTTVTYDAAGRMVQSVKAGIAAGLNYEAQSAVTTNYSKNLLTDTTTVSAGGLSLTSSQTRDFAGRVVSRTDEQGRTTSYAYTNGGQVMTETGPGGITRITTYYLDGQTKSVTGSGIVPEFHDYTLDGSANIVHISYLGTGDNTSPRWRKTVTDGVGQLIAEISPGPNGTDTAITHFYNSSGQRYKTTRTGLADSRLEYDDLGRVTRKGTDLDANGVLGLVSEDPITEMELYYEKDGTNQWWLVQKNRKYLANSNSTDVAETWTRQKQGAGSGAEIHSKDIEGNITISVMAVDRSEKSVTQTITSVLSNISAVQLSINGLLVSQSSLTVSAQTLLRYDALGRQTEVVDPRSGQSTITAYNELGQVSSMTNEIGDVTTYTYYPSTHVNTGLLASQTNDEGETIHYAYDTLGRTIHQWGGAVYPVAYEFNSYGERTQLKTYRSSGDWDSVSLPTAFGSATPSLTTWSFHPASGRLMSKTDAAAQPVTYTYYDSGLIASRTWARGVVVNYGHDEAGRITSVDYSDSTPDVAYTYRRDGRYLTLTDYAGTHAFTYYQDTGSPAGESITAGSLDGLILSRSADGQNRLSGFAAQWGGQTLMSASYGYDGQGRLNSVSEGMQSATYDFTANSNLLHTVNLKTANVTQLTGTRTYDPANRLDTILWTNRISTVVSSHDYAYDGAGRRQRADLADGSYWEYGYNGKGEVTSSVKKNGTGMVYPGLDQGYHFDEIGNRTSSTVDAAAGGSRTASYTSNSLNQYTSISTPAAFDVTGSAVVGAVVKVNTHTSQRLGPYFRRELESDNSAQALWESILIETTLTGAGVGGGDIITQREGNHYVPKANENYVYDEDGNLASDGRWYYTWDGENRLIAMETTSSAATVGVPKSKLVFHYDGQSRRIGKQVYQWNGSISQWEFKKESRYIYDDWNLVAEVNEDGTPLATHVWGLDQSQTLQGAGGVGGLLWTQHWVTGETSFACYDGGGNVTGIVDASSANLVARYDYNAFGETVVNEVKGEDVRENVWRFSTKYEDAETGLLYYGYRYYQPELGRWISRDPIGERGGINLCVMVDNNPLNKWDYLGLWNPISGIAGELLDRATNPGVSWHPPRCGGVLNTGGLESRFIQVFWNNSEPNDRNGEVDRPGIGSGELPPNAAVGNPDEPYYPQELTNDGFYDKPTGLFNVYTTFEVCRVCYCPVLKCIVSVGPCKKWRRYDSGDLSDFPGSETPSDEWWTAVNKKFSGSFCQKGAN